VSVSAAADVSKPLRPRIAYAQAALLRQIEIDLKRASNTCWACLRRDVRRRPERAHIVPARYGARENQPRNYLLLCHECHVAHPDAVAWPEQLAWLLARRRGDA